MRGLLPRQSNYCRVLECGQRARAPIERERGRVCACVYVFVCVCACMCFRLRVCERTNTCPTTSLPPLYLRLVRPVRVLRPLSHVVPSTKIRRYREGWKERVEEETKRTGSRVKGRANVYGLCKTERGSGGSSPINPKVAPSPLIFTS